MSGTATEVAAHIDAAKSYGWKLIPTVAAYATPSGMTTTDAREELCNIEQGGAAVSDGPMWPTWKSALAAPPCSILQASV